MEKYFKLNNDVEIPSIGFGTWQTPEGKTAINSIKIAVQGGYRHIDAAAIYGNEKSIGVGIKECGLERKELFVTSKVWNTERGYESIAGGPNQDWIAPLIDIIGIVYPDLPREQRKKALIYIIRFLRC